MSAVLHLFMFVNVLLAVNIQSPEINLKELGEGTIYLTGNRALIKVILVEVNETWITYEKNKSLHDLSFDRIRYIEFPNAKEGRVQIKFENNKPYLIKFR